MKFAIRNNTSNQKRRCQISDLLILVTYHCARSKADYLAEYPVPLKSNVKYNIFKTHQKIFYAYFNLIFCKKNRFMQ